MGSVLGRNQVATASTGCCGYSGIKQALGIPDIKQVMLDIRHQIESDMETSVHDTDAEKRDLQRVKSALSQVNQVGIRTPGWFSSFLAQVVAKVYGVTILIIRPSGVFTFIQVQVYFNHVYFNHVTPSLHVLRTSTFHRVMVLLAASRAQRSQIAVMSLPSTLCWGAMVMAALLGVISRVPTGTNGVPHLHVHMAENWLVIRRNWGSIWERSLGPNIYVGLVVTLTATNIRIRTI